MKKFLAIMIIIGLFVSGGFTFAYVMSSQNYRIQSDSINVGGVDVQTSTSYKSRETIGEIASDESTSTSYKLKAGYRQMQEVYISISVNPSTVTMSPAIAGLSGGTGNGSTSATVLTDNAAGYTLKVKATSSPALRCSAGGCNVGVDSFADYTPAGANPDYSWQIAASDSEFGFSPEGIHIVPKYQDNGVDACNTGANDTSDKCWYYFSTSDENIAKSFSSNHPSGTPTLIKFRAQSGFSHLQVAGTYQATIIVTAVAN